jgi:hypothetical protein
MLGFNVIGPYIYTAVTEEERKELKDYVDNDIIDIIDSLLKNCSFKVFNTCRYVWSVKHGRDLHYVAVRYGYKVF